MYSVYLSAATHDSPPSPHPALFPPFLPLSPFPMQDLPCFKSQVHDTFTTTSAGSFKDHVVPKHLGVATVCIFYENEVG